MLGIALQAEHNDLLQRRAAPVLALWAGDGLETHVSAVSTGGDAGDIVASPDGGFVLSCQREGLAVAWSPRAPNEMMVVAKLKEVCALASWPLNAEPSGVFMAAQHSAGRWHPMQAPVLRLATNNVLGQPFSLALVGHPEPQAVTGLF